MEKLEDGMQPPVLWTDEKLFTVQAVHNHQNDRIYAINKDDIPLNERLMFQRQKPAPVMVWGGVTSTGEKIPLIFIEEGVKVNQHLYLKMLKEMFPGLMSHLEKTEYLSNKTEPRRTQPILFRNGVRRISQGFG